MIINEIWSDLQSSECRRMLLGSYLSGIGYNCHIDNSAEKCDNCRKQLTEASESFEAVEADVTAMMMNEVEEQDDFFQTPEVGSTILLDNLKYCRFKH